jgi:HlyD family secretion protein
MKTRVQDDTSKALSTIESPSPAEQLPAVVPPGRDGARRRWLKPTLLLIALLLGGIGVATWWLYPRDVLPPGIASGNGRLEADEIDIDTKYAGRVASLFADEGDLTKAGEVLVKMDTRDIEASLKKSQALIVQAQKTLEAAKATLEQQKSQVVFAQQEIARTEALVGKGFATRETYDQQRQILVSAVAGQAAAADAIEGAQAALEAATHDAELYQVEIDDSSLVSPRDGRIEYRVANVGEVLPAGGKVFTMLDTGYVYMDIYLPTLSAGRVKLGSDARIVLDAYPDHAFPATVVFLADQAQFTPKTVETKDERDVLMFRVRVRIDPAALAGHAADVRSGLPGMAYVRTAPDVVWPAALQANASK